MLEFTEFRSRTDWSWLHTMSTGIRRRDPIGRAPGAPGGDPVPCRKGGDTVRHRETPGFALCNVGRRHVL